MLATSKEFEKLVDRLETFFAGQAGKATAGQPLCSLSPGDKSSRHGRAMDASGPNSFSSDALLCRHRSTTDSTTVVDSGGNQIVGSTLQPILTSSPLSIDTSPYPQPTTSSNSSALLHNDHSGEESSSTPVSAGPAAKKLGSSSWTIWIPPPLETVQNESNLTAERGPKKWSQATPPASSKMAATVTDGWSANSCQLFVQQVDGDQEGSIGGYQSQEQRSVIQAEGSPLLSTVQHTLSTSVNDELQPDDNSSMNMVAAPTAVVPPKLCTDTDEILEAMTTFHASQHSLQTQLVPSLPRTSSPFSTTNKSQGKGSSLGGSALNADVPHLLDELIDLDSGWTPPKEIPIVHMGLHQQYRHSDNGPQEEKLIPDLDVFSDPLVGVVSSSSLSDSEKKSLIKQGRQIAHSRDIQSPVIQRLPGQWIRYRIVDLKGREQYGTIPPDMLQILQLMLPSTPSNVYGNVAYQSKPFLRHMFGSGSSHESRAGGGNGSRNGNGDAFADKLLTLIDVIKKSSRRASMLTQHSEETPLTATSSNVDTNALRTIQSIHRREEGRRSSPSFRLITESQTTTALSHNNAMLLSSKIPVAINSQQRGPESNRHHASSTSFSNGDDHVRQLLTHVRSNSADDFVGNSIPHYLGPSRSSSFHALNAGNDGNRPPPGGRYTRSGLVYDLKAKREPVGPSPSGSAGFQRR